MSDIMVNIYIVFSVTLVVSLVIFLPNLPPIIEITGEIAKDGIDLYYTLTEKCPDLETNTFHYTDKTYFLFWETGCYTHVGGNIENKGTLESRDITINCFTKDNTGLINGLGTDKISLLKPKESETLSIDITHICKEIVSEHYCELVYDNPCRR